MAICRFCRKQYSEGIIRDGFCTYQCGEAYRENLKDLQENKASSSTYSSSGSGSGDWSGGCGCLLLGMILVGSISTLFPSKIVTYISKIVSPEVFVENYFKNVKNKDCKTSWNMLSSKVQYTFGYKSFDKWCKENTFEIKEIKLTEKYAALGIVKARILIKPKKGKRRLIEYWYNVEINSARNGVEISHIMSP